MIRKTLLAGAALTLAPIASAAVVTIVNGDFEANPWNSFASTVPDGWTSSVAGGAGDYGQGAPATPNLSSIAAHFQSVGGNYLQQDLSANNPGLTASSHPGYVVTLDHSYRNDAATNGEIAFAIALWDLTNDVEIVSRSFVIANPGVLAGEGSNQFTTEEFTLGYDPSAYTNESIALRLIHASESLGSPWQRTAMIDNVSVTAIPEPSASLVAALGLLGLLRRRRC